MVWKNECKNLILYKIAIAMNGWFVRIGSPLGAATTNDIGRYFILI
jgi:hypothetical protein